MYSPRQRLSQRLSHPLDACHRSVDYDIASPDTGLAAEHAYGEVHGGLRFDKDDIDISRLYDDRYASTATQSQSTFELDEFWPYTAHASQPYQSTTPLTKCRSGRDSIIPRTSHQHDDAHPHSRPLQTHFMPSPTSHNESWVLDEELMFDQETPNQSSTQSQRPHVARLSEAPSSTKPSRGPSLVSTHTLNPRFKSIFSFPNFNRVQSKCFETIYNTSDNFVLSAPTGSGKTAIFELAICRLITNLPAVSFKIIYQAPTKSLCSERFRDWQAKFKSLGFDCAELTGDTHERTLAQVQHATIIITTPEKWDSVTRRWKDQQKLLSMVKLFLIDEVHILGTSRGASLEAIVSRMKSASDHIRYVAVSATIPNAQDIARWLGKDAAYPTVPAAREHFGDEFRPVRLVKKVYGYRSDGNDFAFEKLLNNKLLEILPALSQHRPIMVFCMTRNACSETAKLLAIWGAKLPPSKRGWAAPRKCLMVEDKDLRETAPCAVAFHHAGLSASDRSAVEQGYLCGDVNIICCTSTLAIGVNLPCHMVIVKNTVSYQSSSRTCKEYSDLEVMQMLGRAGRPQFDKSAIAVIMTRLEKVERYERVTGRGEIVESCLHLNLVEHINAEIGLGTITDLETAKKWLSSTFLFIRLHINPDHYHVEGDTTSETPDERLEAICKNAVDQLAEHGLVDSTIGLRCTEFGMIMTRFYIEFESMKNFMTLPGQPKTSEILSVICNAAEFKDVRLRANERNVYKELNKHASIRFQIPVNLNGAPHKVSLVIQAVLGDINDFDEAKHRYEFQAARAVIFQHLARLIRGIVDCQIERKDSTGVRNGLMLARSFAAKAWDDSPLHLKQLDTLGPVYVRKLVGIGIKRVQDLEDTEAHRIETALTRNPPFGRQLHDKAAAFPKLSLQITSVGAPVIHKEKFVAVSVLVRVKFSNKATPLKFDGKCLYICALLETSDGQLLHFTRVKAHDLQKDLEIRASARLTNPTQTIVANAMCEDVAGTSCRAFLQLDLPASAFAAMPPAKCPADEREGPSSSNRNLKAHTKMVGDRAGKNQIKSQSYDDGFIDIDHIDSAQQPTATVRLCAQPDKIGTKPNGRNGPCNHTCKNKSACKHLCCREGVKKRSNNASRAKVSPNSTHEAHPRSKQTHLNSFQRASSLLSQQQEQRKSDAHLISSKRSHLPKSNRPTSSSLGKRFRTESIFPEALNGLLTRKSRVTEIIESDSESDYGMSDCEILDLTRFEQDVVMPASADRLHQGDELVKDSTEKTPDDIRVKLKDDTIDEFADDEPTKRYVNSEPSADIHHLFVDPLQRVHHATDSHREIVWRAKYQTSGDYTTSIKATQYPQAGQANDTASLQRTSDFGQASGMSQLGKKVSDAQNAQTASAEEDDLERWFKAEFGTVLFEYVG